MTIHSYYNSNTIVVVVVDVECHFVDVVRTRPMLNNHGLDNVDDCFRSRDFRFRSNPLVVTRIERSLMAESTMCRSKVLVDIVVFAVCMKILVDFHCFDELFV